MLALAAFENWYITGLDVWSAYLYGKLDKEIYMEQPEGFAAPGQERKVLHLWHALYGLKQASLAWWRTLDESLKELGFERLKSEAGIFSTRRKAPMLLLESYTLGRFKVDRSHSRSRIRIRSHAKLRLTVY